MYGLYFLSLPLFLLYMVHEYCYIYMYMYIVYMYMHQHARTALVMYSFPPSLLSLTTIGADSVRSVFSALKCLLASLMMS